MTLLILVGVWALAFGHVSLTGKMKMKGSQARIFGLIAIALAAHALPQAAEFLGAYAPKFVAKNETFMVAFNGLIGAGALYLAGWITMVGLPKLKIPMISISVKRSR